MNEEALFVALYLDADVDRKLADRMRAEGFEAVSAREVGNDELSESLSGRGDGHDKGN